MLSRLGSLGGLSLLFGLVNLAAAQTFTDCNPMERDDCPTCPALSMNYNFDFTQASNASTWDVEAGVPQYQQDGAILTINKQKESPTLTSQFYLMFGIVEVHMKASRGQGIVSSIVMESKDLDEIDWELIGGNETHVQTNYFGKGNQTTYDRALWHPVDKPMDDYHNYTVHWTAEKIDFFIDTALVRTLPYAAANGGNNYPQTPMFVRFGIWAGGDTANNAPGVVEWAGGATDFTKAPFTMYVKSLSIQDFGSGSAYKYSDRSGSWQSISSIPGNSTQKVKLLAIPEPQKPSVSEQFSALPQGSKTAVYAGSASGGAILLGLLVFFCYRQRRQGRREAAAYRAKQEAMDREDAAYQVELKTAGISPDSLGHAGMTAQEYAAGGVAVASMGTAAGAGGFGSSHANKVAPMPVLPGSYHDVSQGSVNSPTIQTSPGHNAYGDSGLRSPTASPPGYNGGQFNSPRSPGPGGYSANAPSGGIGMANSNNGYFPVAAPNNTTPELYAPQPRANTNGSWSNAAAAMDMGRSASSASQWGQQAQPERSASTVSYGQRPAANNNGYQRGY